MADAPTGKVTFVGAGPGAADLLTFRAARAIAEADVVIWAASLVQAEVLDHAREGAEILDSATMSLEDVVAVYERARAEGLRVARIHSGDPALWGGTQEQLDRCAGMGIETEVIPGVSAFSAVAALAQRELTIPEVAQSVVLTRLGGGKTPMPPGEEVREFARHGTTMAIFLSAARSGQLVRELLEGGYPTETPVVVAYQATWPEDWMAELVAAVTARGLTSDLWGLDPDDRRDRRSSTCGHSSPTSWARSRAIAASSPRAISSA